MHERHRRFAEPAWQTGVCLTMESLSFIFNILKKNEKVRFRNISPARRASIAFLPRLKGRPHRLTTWKRRPGPFPPVAPVPSARHAAGQYAATSLPFALYGAFPDETSIKRLRRISFSTFFPDSARPASGMIRSALSSMCRTWCFRCKIQYRRKQNSALLSKRRVPVKLFRTFRATGKDISGSSAP